MTVGYTKVGYRVRRRIASGFGLLATHERIENAMAKINSTSSTTDVNDVACSRRSLLAAGAGVGVALLTGHSATRASTPVASPAASANGVQPDGTWAFTDDRGVTVTLPTTPQRVIADVNVAAALWDLGVRPVGIFGWNITGEKELNAAGGNVDPNAVEFLNDPVTTLDVERAAAIQPDLIVSLVFAEQYGIWSIDPEVQSRVEQIAPIVAISGIIRADESMNHFVELAGALGADLTAPEISAQREAYDTASARLQAVAGAKSGITAIFVAATPADIYIASPDAAGDLMLFRDLGLEIPTLPVPEGEYWEQLSTEQALKYPSDILFYSVRGDLTTPDDFLNHPTFSQHPAVKAGQLFAWNQDVILNYAGIAASLDAVSAAVEASDAAVAS